MWSHGHVDFIFGAQQLEIVKVLLCLFQFNLLLERLLEVLCHDSILDKYNDFRLGAFGGIIIEDFYQLLDFLRYSGRLLDLFLLLYLIEESELFQDLIDLELNHKNLIEIDFSKMCNNKEEAMLKI